MRKKIVSIMALSLVATMGAASLTGCGTQAKATDVIVEDGDTIIVDDEDTETAKVEIMETETTDETAITSTEVIGGSDEALANFAGAEDDNIVLYSERGKQDYCPLNETEYTASEETIVAKEDVPLYDVNGFAVGYIKTGAIVNIDEAATTLAWSRFVNPIAGTDYDYLYVMNDYLSDEETVIVTAEDMRQEILELMNNRAYELPTVLDTPTDDMEVFECRMAKEYSDESDVDYWVNQNFYLNDNAHRLLGLYMTYCVECEDDGDGIICKVYYKDLNEAFVE